MVRDFGMASLLSYSLESRTLCAVFNLGFVSRISVYSTMIASSLQAVDIDSTFNVRFFTMVVFVCFYI